MPSSTFRICTGVFLSSFCFFLAVPLIPLYIVELDPRSPLAGPTIAVSFALSALLSPLWGALAQRYGPKPMLVRAAALVSGAYAVSACATDVGVLFASRCLAGVASGFVPVATAALAQISHEDRRSTELGWLSSAKSAGALLGPAFGGLLVWWTGSFRLAFLIASVASLVTLAIAF
jgi:DHA1 family multidrug resistance protein-like MFS transporter